MIEREHAVDPELERALENFELNHARQALLGFRVYMGLSPEVDLLALKEAQNERVREIARAQREEWGNA